jgi:hypothetical protein
VDALAAHPEDQLWGGASLAICTTLGVLVTPDDTDSENTLSVFPRRCRCRCRRGCRANAGAGAGAGLALVGYGTAA